MSARHNLIPSLLAAATITAFAQPAPAMGPAVGETVAIVGAKVHTLGPAGTLDGATVLLVDGKIKAVGRDVAVPAGARRVDATGKVVTPGFFDSLTRLGVVEVPGVAGTRDGSVKGDDMTAAFDVVDALNPWSMLIPINRVEGLTHAVVAPSAGDGLFAGRGAVIHLGGLDEANSDMVVKSPAAMFAVLGETGAEHAGGSRAAAMALLREALDDAADLAAHRAAVDSNDRRPYSLSRRDLEALQPVIEGKLPLVVEVKRAADIEAVLRLAHDYHLKLILSKATEAWKVAPQIAAAGVPVLMDPLDNLPDSFETLGATLEAAARLQKAGVTVAFATNDAHNARNLRQSAGNAVTYGMPWEEALRAITLNPARIWGLADRYGSLEPGKDADVVVWDGDPLEDTTMADAVFIHGVQMPTRTRQTELRERYRTLKGDLPLAYRQP